MHFQVLILTSSMSGKSKKSYWQAFSYARDSIHEAFFHLGLVPLESTVADVTKIPGSANVASCSRNPSAADKMYIVVAACLYAKHLGLKYKVNHLYCTDLCCRGAEEDSCKIFPVVNMLIMT